MDKYSSLKKVVFTCLRKQWSTEKISACIKKKYDDSNIHLSPESIYTYLYVSPRGKLSVKRYVHALHKDNGGRNTGWVTCLYYTVNVSNICRY